MTKKNIQIIIRAFALATVFAQVSCGDVAEDERWSLPQEVVPTKNVLVEDFTGQRCVNCPEATEAIEELQQRVSSRYGGNHIVAVAIHGGSMAITDDYPMGLATAEGNAMHNALEIDAWPAGMVDRTGGICRYTEWTGRAISRMAVVPDVEITISGAKALEGTPQAIQVTVMPTTAALPTTEHRLFVWLTENNIKALQFMPDGSRNSDYIHNHVFRVSLTDLEGKLLPLFNSSSTEAGNPVSETFSFSPKSSWNVLQMNVVAFVTNENGVCQVVEVPLWGCSAESHTGS